MDEEINTESPGSEKRIRDCSPASEVSGTKRKKKNDPVERVMDSFCWICHRSKTDESCTECDRSFHKTCLKLEKQEVCMECNEEAKAFENRELFLTDKRFKEIASELTNSFLKNFKSVNKDDFLEWSLFYKDELVHEVDFSRIQQKIKDPCKAYVSFKQIFNDVRWMHHNFCIVSGVNSPIAKEAANIVKLFQKEISNVEACCQCYYRQHIENKKDYFLDICDPPHEIVWAWLKGSPAWPAKCLRVENSKALVHFFGTHDKSSIALGNKKVLHISLYHPTYKTSKITDTYLIPKKKDYKIAVEELLFYVKNCEKKFKQPFVYHEVGTSFKTEEEKQKTTPRRRRKKTKVYSQQVRRSSRRTNNKSIHVPETTTIENDDNLSEILENDATENPLGPIQITNVTSEAPNEENLQSSNGALVCPIVDNTNPTKEQLSQINFGASGSSRVAEPPQKVDDDEVEFLDAVHNSSGHFSIAALLSSVRKYPEMEGTIKYCQGVIDSIMFSAYAKALKLPPDAENSFINKLTDLQSNEEDLKKVREMKIKIDKVERENEVLRLKSGAQTNKTVKLMKKNKEIKRNANLLKESFLAESLNLISNNAEKSEVTMENFFKLNYKLLNSETKTSSDGDKRSSFKSFICNFEYLLYASLGKSLEFQSQQQTETTNVTKKEAAENKEIQEEKPEKDMGEADCENLKNTTVIENQSNGENLMEIQEEKQEENVDEINCEKIEKTSVIENLQSSNENEDDQAKQLLCQELYEAGSKALLEHPALRAIKSLIQSLKKNL